MIRYLRLPVSIILVVSIICCFFITASAAPVTTGLTFSSTDTYRLDIASISLPATYEATVYFSKDMKSSTRGGVIIGNYSGAGAGFNFEIYKNGNPRIFITDDNGNERDVIFTDVCVYTGKKTHVAITVDWESGIYQCYLNGALAQTIEDTPFSTFNFTDTLCLGGDLRISNSAYFKGILQKVALYTDIRTEKEIASDAKASSPKKSNLSIAYDLTSYTPGSYPITLDSIVGPNVTYENTQKWYDTGFSVDSADYSFALVGDIQTMNLVHPDQLSSIFDWILENKEEKKIAHVFHLGDITDDSTDAEWERAKEQYLRLNDEIPYSFVRGNHDKIDDYNRHMSYEEFGHLVDGAFESNMCNTYQTITVEGINYLILNLDLTASDFVLDWANEIVESHPDYNVIVNTHLYLTRTGKRMTSLPYNSVNSAEQLWEKFISQHENIVMVFCGHIATDQIIVSKDTGIHGNEVTQILVDPQYTDLHYSGTGMVALLHFSNGGSRVDVEYYSTVKEQYFLLSNQFSFDVHTVTPATSDAPVVEVVVPETEPEVTETIPEPTLSVVETEPAETTPTEEVTPTEDSEYFHIPKIVFYGIVTLLVVNICVNVILFISLRWTKRRRRRNKYPLY